MKILLSGGGTGGHITPILAVAHELKQLQPDCYLIYVGERNGKFAGILKDNPDIDESHTIYAGKFRRYHGESWLIKLLDVKSNILNLRDFFYFLVGRHQSSRLLKKVQPDIVFLKGGFVGVPVGLAAGRQQIKIITHDSDALPGLANRLVSRYVSVHATALPPEIYPYPTAKTIQVGVLVEHSYQFVTPDLQAQYKNRLDIDETATILLVTGGSTGAVRLNQAVVKVAGDLLEKYPTLHIIHQVGKGNAETYQGYQHERLHVLEFLSPMFQYMGSADLVVCRASGNTVAELGVQGKACIVVPNPYLTGGHQLKNAQDLAKKEAAVVVLEENLDSLSSSITGLLDDTSKRQHLADKLNAMIIPDAAKRLAKLILETPPKL